MKMAEIAASMGTPEDINDAQKKQAVDAWEKIAQYVTPRLKAVEVAHAEGQQFVIQVKR